MSAPRQAPRSASGFLALVTSVTACQLTTDQNGRVVVPTFDATTVTARTTLEHVTLEATTVHLEQEGPETPAGGAQFSCASPQTFVIGGTATALDEPREVVDHWPLPSRGGRSCATFTS